MDIYEKYKNAQDKATFFRNCSYEEKKALIEILTEISSQAEYKDLISRLNEGEKDEFLSEIMAEKEMIKAENEMIEAEKQYLIAKLQWAKAAKRRYAFIHKRSKKVNQRIEQDVDPNGRPRNSDELVMEAVNILKEYADTGYFDFLRRLKEYGLIQGEEAEYITSVNEVEALQDMEAPQDKGASRK